MASQPVPGPARTRLKAPERRGLIVQAALEEFARGGYDAASMRRIGAAAGISRTVLYDHFPSKRALFLALLRETHAALLSQMRGAMLGDAPMQTRMRSMIDAFLLFARLKPVAWRVLFPDHPPLDPGVAEDHRRCRSESNRLFAELLEPDARRAGVDPASHVGEAIFAMHQAALHGAVRWWHAHPDASHGELVDAAMAVIWTGLGAAERGEQWVPGAAAPAPPPGRD
ncbi:MAG: TetR/AcrR family transcriptional regulator [Solirubrobacteraceae bacterium]